MAETSTGVAEAATGVAGTEPRADRPRMPGYGVPESTEGLLPWAEAAGRLERARNYWVATAGADGQPHAVPVWGVWLDGALYFGVGPRSARNLAANPRVAVHLESGDEVVIVEGEVETLRGPSAELSRALDDASAAKYDWRPSGEGEDPVGEGSYVLRPRLAYAWTKFPDNATRWRFAAAD